jgi:carboxyl-terminal processing protease
MGSKLKVAGWLAIGAVAGALTTMQLQATARSAMSPLPLEDMQQLKKIGGMEFYDVNFSYTDNDSFEEHYVSVTSGLSAKRRSRLASGTCMMSGRKMA